MKITVTDNSQSNWASITEIDVSGAESSGTNGGSGYHYDPAFHAKGSNFQDVSSSASLPNYQSLLWQHGSRQLQISIQRDIS